ncbi:hypothetical protein ABL78_4427 [Leptomonas seymouri]|uniref:Uncharacterized protein n=1 Tax=Leptomonas seymouri TaxID=5684 RepID=A0A0N0P5X1_LEPSE|nr:hypothetical protein ABL78_4427 [Leptomonas seymouri]|eukprot:KPI86487.1 hypothetical protein ABL78_4427 [Leptomonas seymouri]
MSRSTRSSMSESCHSLADSMGEEEFLSASPFNPKHLERHRAHRGPCVNKTAFQPEFFRIDSMAYRGRGIVEDNDRVAPVAFALPKGRPAQPPCHPGSAAGAKSSADRKGGRLMSNHMLLDTDRVSSATRHRTNNWDGHCHADGQSINPPSNVPTFSAPPQLMSSMHFPPALSLPFTPSRNGVLHSSLNPRSNRQDVTSAGRANAPKDVTVAPPASSAATASRVHMSTSATTMAPLSPIKRSTDSFNPSAASAPLGVRHPHSSLPPRVPTTSIMVKASPRAGNVDVGRVQRQAGRLDLINLGNSSNNSKGKDADRQSALHGEGHKEEGWVGFIAPLSPGRPSRAEDDGSLPSSALRGTGAANSSSLQSSVSALPMLSMQGSISDNGNNSVSPRVVVRQRNSSPSRAKNSSAMATGTSDAGVSGAAAWAGSNSLQVSGSNVSESNRSNYYFSAPLLGARVRASDSSTSSAKEVASLGPSSVGRSSVMLVTPSNSSNVNVGVSGRTPASPQESISSAFQVSVAPSVVDTPWRSSYSSSCTSSASSTPAATPTATLRLMSDKTPTHRLAAAKRLAVPPISVPNDGACCQVPVPPQPPTRKSLVPMCVPVYDTTVLEVLHPCNNSRSSSIVRPGSPDARQDGVPTNLKTTNEEFLNMARHAQRRRSLLDSEVSSMSNSVRRQYYCLPSTEETSIPNFARRAGDLHVKANGAHKAVTGDTGRERTSTKHSDDDDNDDVEWVPFSTDKSPSTRSCSKRTPASTSPSASPPASRPSFIPSAPQGDRRSSSAVPQDYFLDLCASLHKSGWSPQSERLVTPVPCETGSEAKGTEEDRERLLQDALRAFNHRCRMKQLKD